MKNAAAYAAGALRDLGVRRGDRVLTECTQNAAYLACRLGIALLGAVFVPFDRRFTDQRIREIAEETEAVCLAGTDPRRAALPFFSLSSLRPDLPEGDLPEALPSPEEIAEILYSTGTTGKSKGIVITGANNAAVAQNVGEGVGMEPGNVELVPVPLSHSHGLRTVYANLYRGNAVAIASGVAFLKPFFDLAERYGATALDLAPGAWRIIRKNGVRQIGDLG